MARRERLKDLKEKMLARRKYLVEEISRRLEASGVSHRASDLLDSAFDSLAEDILLRVAENEAGELADIDVALGRIEEGAYGICEGCGEEIPSRRLAMLPGSRFCVACKSESERLAPVDAGGGGARKIAAVAEVIDSSGDDDAGEEDEGP